MSRYKIYKDIIDTSVCLYCCYELYNRTVINAPYVMFFYSILDLPFNTTSLKIHHAITAISSLAYICDDISKDKHDCLLQFMQCEYSTVFLCTKKLLENYSNKTPIINIGIRTSQVAFVITFLYYRLYNQFDILSKMNSINANYTNQICIHVLYLINIYWLTKIFKKITPIWQFYVPTASHDVYYLTQYMYITIPIYNTLIMTSNVYWSSVLYIISSFINSFSAYIYNVDYYESLTCKQRVNPHLYLYERMSVHVRSHIGLLAVCLYRDVTMDVLFVIFSLVTHVYSMYNFHLDYYREFHLKPHVLKHEKIIYKLPVFFDNLCLYLISGHYEKTVVHTFLYLILFISFVQPFGPNTHHHLFYPFVSNFLVVRGIYYQNPSTFSQLSF